MKFFLSFLIFLNVIVHAFDEDNKSDYFEPNVIDIYHGMFSAKVYEWGIGIDKAILNSYEFFEENNNSGMSKASPNDYIVDINTSGYIQENNISTTADVDTTLFAEDVNESKTEELPLAARLKGPMLEEGLGIEEFFLTRKLLEERDKSYVRVSFVESFNSLEKEVFTATVRARLYLGRSRKKLRLFIENLNDDTAKNIGTDNDKEAPAIGIERRSHDILGVKQRYSIGVRGFDLFARARYWYESNVGIWRVEPVQTFTYSIKNEFSELTELYLDTPTSESTLLRFVIDRGTQSGEDGMQYDGFVQWFYQHRRYGGLSFNLGFNGHTNYENTVDGSNPPLIQEENKVFNYLFLMRWRENFWRKWLFYEIGPGVNYHEQHDYRPNYNIFFGIDMFFGHV